VHVIPLKMTEAWLLTNESVIRQAVGNPTGKSKLNLPKIRNIEGCDAKFVLNEALVKASELGAHRRRKFNPEQFRHRVSDLTTDLSSLRKIPSFAKLESDLKLTLSNLNLFNAAI